MLLTNFRHLHCDEVLTLKLDLPQEITKSMIFYIFFIFLRVATEKVFWAKRRKLRKYKNAPENCSLKTKTGQLFLAGLLKLLVLIFGHNFREIKTSDLFIRKSHKKQNKFFVHDLHTNQRHWVFSWRIT